MSVQRPLVQAVVGNPVDRVPMWMMRQAGRYLPEYRELRKGKTFQESVHDVDTAAEITLQPIRRFGFDGAVVFLDIMTPLEAMDVEVTFAPGPTLTPRSLREIADLPSFESERLSFVGDIIASVRRQAPEQCAVIGFSGAPLTLLAYLTEGGGSPNFFSLRSQLLADRGLARDALHRVADAMNAYLALQVAAGADVVQLFDTWAGLLAKDELIDLAYPAAARTLAGIDVPRIYFAPNTVHGYESVASIVDADAYGLDWRLPVIEAWDRIGARAVQGNLDPAVLLTDESTIRRRCEQILDGVDGRPGYVFNLGHGIDRHSPVANVEAMVDAVRSHRSGGLA